MINKSTDNKLENSDRKEDKIVSKPNEQSGVYYSSHIKIYDPNTNEVFVQKRADD
jgi:hypothetical protein